jgi:hypothetical protein
MTISVIVKKVSSRTVPVVDSNWNKPPPDRKPAGDDVIHLICNEREKTWLRKVQGEDDINYVDPQTQVRIEKLRGMHAEKLCM